MEHEAECDEEDEEEEEGEGDLSWGSMTERGMSMSIDVGGEEKGVWNMSSSSLSLSVCQE